MTVITEECFSTESAKFIDSCTNLQQMVQTYYIIITRPLSHFETGCMHSVYTYVQPWSWNNDNYYRYIRNYG